MKLKTLKDIENLGMLRENIRAEAIKWVKKGRKNLEEYKDDRDYVAIEFGVRRFVKDFFNVTEEEFK